MGLWMVDLQFVHFGNGLKIPIVVVKRRIGFCTRGGDQAINSAAYGQSLLAAIARPGRATIARSRSARDIATRVRVPNGIREGVQREIQRDCSVTPRLNRERERHLKGTRLPAGYKRPLD